jgi:hypothetical protein
MRGVLTPIIDSKPLGVSTDSQVPILGVRESSSHSSKVGLRQSALGGDKLFAFGSTTVRNNMSTCNDLCAQGGDYSTAVGNNYWDNVHTSDPSSRGKRLGGEPSTLMQHAQRTSGSLGGWGRTPFRISPHNVECKKGEG